MRALLELSGVVMFRFKPLPRVWATWLVAVNGAAVAFIGHIEAQVVLLAVVVAVGVQALIYQRWGFVRVLGAAHVVWLPMLVWLGTRLGGVGAGDDALRIWLYVLIGTNAISLVIDAVDVTRFVRGEREPHYVWQIRHLVDRVLPEVPFRQQVLTLPFELRYRVSFDPVS